MILFGTKRETIEKWSLGYFGLKPVSTFGINRYFPVNTLNEEKIPYDEICIFALNHQNALMDALGALAVLKGQPIFLARADIFQNKIANKFLTFLKIMPVFRIRDGKESLKNNDAIFLKTIDVLKNKNGLAILPEGTHGDKRRLAPLKKGIFRLAFQAEEMNDFNLNIKIVPVGLDYTHYYKFGSPLFINFGDPISLSEYYDEYKENQPKALTSLSKRLSAELKKVMIHIENDDFYDFQNNITRIYAPYMAKKMGLKNSKQPNQFFAEQKIVEFTNKFIEEKPEEAEELKNKTIKYLDQLKKSKLRNWILAKGKISFLGSLSHLVAQIALLPIFIFGFINNIIPFSLPVFFARNIKDTQFISSFRYVIALILFQLFYIIQGILAFTLIDGFLWFKIAYIISLPFSGIFAFKYYKYYRKLIGKWRFLFKKASKNKDLMDLQQNYKEIIEKMDNITN